MTNLVETKNNAVGWFEIPVSDMARAVKFYETVLDVKFEPYKVGEHEMALFPMTEGRGASGALVYHKEFYKTPKDPKEGVLIYFTSHSGDLTNESRRIDQAGGRVVVPRESIGAHGFIAIFLDSEGNRVALHSRK